MTEYDSIANHPELNGFITVPDDSTDIHAGYEDTDINGDPLIDFEPDYERIHEYMQERRFA